MENSDWKVFGQAESLEEIPFLAQKVKDSSSKEDKIVAVVDLQIKGSFGDEESGLDAVKIFGEKGIPSVIYSAFDSGFRIESAVNRTFGAMGFVSKSADEKVLLEAINAVSDGERFIQKNLVSRFIEVSSIFSLLTKREKEVLNLIDQNFSNEQISKKMNIKRNTLENYISIIYDKLGCKDRNALMEKLNS